MAVELPKEPFSPKLRLAMQEIEQVCRRHDCMGLIMLQSEQHSEFKLHIDASWSMLEYAADPDGDKDMRILRFKMRKDPKMHRNGDYSVGAIHGFLRLCSMFEQALGRIILGWAEHFETEHVSGPITNEGRTT
jgi:hypothetical protein